MKYPIDYSHVDAAVQEKILKYYDEHVFEPGLRCADEVLALFDIYVEYNWPGHRGEYFLATEADWLDYEDYQYSLRD